MTAVPSVADISRRHAVRFIVLLGVVSLFADMTYEGARSITGPYLALLGASATAVGFVAGFGFVAALSMAAWGAGVLGAAGWGILGGAALATLLWAMYVGLRKSEATSSYNQEELVGLIGEVSERIYPNSVGQVACAIKGTKVWYTARAVDGGEIPVGRRVKVANVTGGVLYVAPE